MKRNKLTAVGLYVALCAGLAFDLRQPQAQELAIDAPLIPADVTPGRLVECPPRAGPAPLQAIARTARTAASTSRSSLTRLGARRAYEIL